MSGFDSGLLSKVVRVRPSVLPVVEEVSAEMFCPKKLIDKRNVLLPLVCIRKPEKLSAWCQMAFEVDVYQDDSRHVTLSYRRLSSLRISKNS